MTVDSPGSYAARGISVVSRWAGAEQASGGEEDHQ